MTEAQLDELRPLANTGDLNVMRTMFEGVRSWSEVKTEILGYSNYGPGNADAFRALSGLWAVMLWREGERSPKLAQEIDYCLGAMKIKWSRVEGKLCGFSATFDGDYEHDITRYGDGKKGAKPPRSAVFDEWPMAPKATPEEERARFEALLAAYRRGETNKDSAWISSWIQKQSPETQDAWSSALDEYWKIANGRQGAERVAGEERRKAEIVEWDELQAKRVAAKAAGKGLPAEEEERFVRLSFSLRGRHIVPMGQERVFTLQVDIDEFCAHAPGIYCDRQRNLAYARENAAMEERVSRENAWKIDRSRGDVTVRNYDQSGNYLGSSSLPAWQADILTGN